MLSLMVLVARIIVSIMVSCMLTLFYMMLLYKEHHSFETTMDENKLYQNIEYAQQVDDCNGCEFMMSCR